MSSTRIAVLISAAVILLVVGLSGWFVFNQLYVTEQDITALVEKNNLTELYLIIDNPSGYHFFPNKEAIQAKALKAAYQKDSSRFIDYAWGSIFKAQIAPYKPDDFCKATDQKGIEEIATRFSVEQDAITKDGFAPEMFGTVIEKLRQSYPSSEVLADLLNKERNAKIEDEGAKLIALLDQGGKLETAGAVFDDLKKYGFTTNELETIYKNYTDNRKKIDAFESQMKADKDIINSANFSISQQQSIINQCNDNIKKYGYPVLKGVCFGSIANSSNAFCLTVESDGVGMAKKGDIAIVIVSSGKRYYIGQRVSVSVYTSTAESTLVYYNGSQKPSRDYREVSADDMKKLNDSIALQQKTISNAQAEIAKIKSGISANTAKVAPIQNQQNELIAKENQMKQQWASLFEAMRVKMSPKLADIAASIVDGKK